MVLFGRVDQSGMIATLASWRPRVQIPPRPLSFLFWFFIPKKSQGILGEGCGGFAILPVYSPVFPFVHQMIGQQVGQLPLQAAFAFFAQPLLSTKLQ